MDDIDYMNLLIQMNDPDDHTTIKALAEELTEATGVSANISKTDNGDTSEIEKIINKLFYSIIAVTMFLCFFSLSASMSANLYEQKKEVAVLRAMGFTKIRLRLLYFYEAVIMVVASCTLGVMIGVIVGYTMVFQQNLLLKQKLALYFPWQQFLYIVGISLICAFLSTWTPAAQLTNKPIAAIFRMT